MPKRKPYVDCLYRQFQVKCTSGNKILKHLWPFIIGGSRANAHSPMRLQGSDDAWKISYYSDTLKDLQILQVIIGSIPTRDLFPIGQTGQAPGPPNQSSFEEKKCIILINFLQHMVTFCRSPKNFDNNFLSNKYRFLVKLPQFCN